MGRQHSPGGGDVRVGGCERNAVEDMSIIQEPLPDMEGELGGSPHSPIDRNYLARFTLGNATLERQILELFAAQLVAYVEQLRAAATEKEWKLAAPTIKGSAAAVGAQRLAALAQTAECLDWSTEPAARERARRRAAEAVGAASADVCDFIACVFATA
jgi:HPt (histidine-containing phosphotransfer) domain-containing protein